jgi:hypothetical protein
MSAGITFSLQSCDKNVPNVTLDAGSFGPNYNDDGSGSKIYSTEGNVTSFQNHPGGISRKNQATTPTPCSVTVPATVAGWCTVQNGNGESNVGLVATAYGPASVQGLANEGGVNAASAGTVPVQVGKSINGYKIQCSPYEGTPYEGTPWS